MSVIFPVKPLLFKAMNEQLISLAEDSFYEEKNYPNFKSGDTITVTTKIVEGAKERLQSFRGTVIQRRGAGKTQTFTIRKISDSVGVERIFPLLSPSITNIELNKSGRVRRARIFYLRKLRGKKARIKEKKFSSAQ